MATVQASEKSFAPGPLSSLSLTPDFSKLAVISNHNAVYVTSLPSPSSTTSVPSDQPTNLSSLSTNAAVIQSQSITSLIFPHPSCLYITDTRGQLLRYDPSTLQPSSDAPSSPSASSSLSPTFKIPAAHSGVELTCVAALSDRSHIFTGGKDGIIRCWDPSTCKSVTKLVSHRYDVRALALASSSTSTAHDDQQNHDLSIVVSGGRDRTVKLWDVRTGFEHRSGLLHTFEGHTGWVHDLAVLGQNSGSGGSDSHDPVVVSCSGDKSVRVWDMRTMKNRAIFKGHQYRIWSVDIAAVPRFAVSSSTDATVRLWDIDSTGESDEAEKKSREVVLEGHSDSVLSVVVSSDGNQIISACEDGTLYSWTGNGNRRFSSPTTPPPQYSSAKEEDKPQLLIDISESTPSPATLSSNSDPNMVPRHLDSNRPAVIVSTSTSGPERDPEYDKSAAELVRALTRIQQLEGLLKDAERRASEYQRAVSALRTEVARRDENIKMLESQVEHTNRLNSALQVNQLLQSNQRKMDIHPENSKNDANDNEFAEPVNKIGAVSDQLSKLAARLDAMITTS